MSESNLERLERIKNTWTSTLTISGMRSGKTQFLTDMRFLIEQSEYAIQAEPVIKKVAELNEYISNTNIDPKRWGDSVIDIAIDELGRLKDENYQMRIKYENTGTMMDRAALRAENRRLREALRFYADPKSFEVNVEDQWAPVILIDKDKGAIARQALEDKS